MQDFGHETTIAFDSLRNNCRFKITLNPKPGTLLGFRDKDFWKLRLGLRKCRAYMDP